MSELFREGLRRLQEEEFQRQQAPNPGEIGAILKAVQPSAKAA